MMDPVPMREEDADLSDATATSPQLPRDSVNRRFLAFNWIMLLLYSCLLSAVIAVLARSASDASMPLFAPVARDGSVVLDQTVTLNAFVPLVFTELFGIVHFGCAIVLRSGPVTLPFKHFQLQIATTTPHFYYWDQILSDPVSIFALALVTGVLVESAIVIFVFAVMGTWLHRYYCHITSRTSEPWTAFRYFLSVFPDIVFLAVWMAIFSAAYYNSRTVGHLTATIVASFCLFLVQSGVYYFHLWHRARWFSIMVCVAEFASFLMRLAIVVGFVDGLAPDMWPRM